MTLFSGVGTGSNAANFTGTVFDDNATTPIQNGSAPFSAIYNPQESLATVFAPTAGGQQGMNVQGTWTLIDHEQLHDRDDRHDQRLVADLPEAAPHQRAGRAGE